MSQTTSSAMSEGPHLCLKNMLSKTEIVQLKALAVNKLPIRRIFELTGFIVPHRPTQSATIARQDWIATASAFQ